MDPLDNSPPSHHRQIDRQQDDRKSSSQSHHLDFKSSLQPPSPSGSALSSGPPSPSPYFASEASNQRAPLFRNEEASGPKKSLVQAPEFTLTEYPDEDSVEPATAPPRKRPSKTTRFLIPEEVAEEDEEDEEEDEKLADDSDSDEDLGPMAIPGERRRPTPYFPEGTLLDPGDTRRPTPYFPDGTNLAPDGGTDRGSVGDGGSQTSSTNHLMVSQHMMDKLAAFDGSNAGSINSQDDLKPLAPKEGKSVFSEKPKRRARGRRRRGNKWYNYYSTRTNILIVTAICTIISLALGVGVGVYRKIESEKPAPTATWRPAPGLTWQIQLSSPVADPSYLFSVYETDLFDTSSAQVTAMHALGRRVICYFSAGTYESWRPDANKFQTANLGDDVSGSDTERWVDITNTDVRSIMASRIALAASKGCDGIDPSHVDGFEKTTTGLSLTADKAVDYIEWLSNTALKHKLSLGLRNAPSIASRVVDKVDWAVVENCIQYQECDIFQVFIQAGRPVMHIEYPDSTNNTLFAQSTSLAFYIDAVCSANGTHLFSTILKKVKLDSWYLDCPLPLLSGVIGNQSSRLAQQGY